MTVLTEPTTTSEPTKAIQLHTPSVWGGGDPHRTAGTSPPLRTADPVNIDGYRLVSRLGAGGMADVFSAVAPSGRPVVVKVLRTGRGIPRTCQREFRLMNSVDERCTARALGYGISTAGPYLVTARLPGYRSVSTLVGQALPAQRLWRLGSTLARVLAMVHARGVVHCDVKPSNLLIRGHDLRLIDFGIARYIGEESPDDGTVQCSPGFAAPEQLFAAPATPAMDIFTWGCLIAYLASGIHPFASRSEHEWILRVQSAQPDLTALPAGLDKVIRWTLARKPRNRPSATELATICSTRYHELTRPMPELMSRPLPTQRR